MSYSSKDLLDDIQYTDRLAEARRKQEEEKRRQAAAAAQRSKNSQQQRQTPAQAARTAQPATDPAGIITQAGQWLQERLNPIDVIDNGVEELAGNINRLPDHALTRPLKAAANEVSRVVPSQQQVDQTINAGLDRLKQSDNELVSSVGQFGENLQSMELGRRAGVMFPATVAARLAGQDSPWENAPAFIKDNPVGPTLFRIAEIVTPTLVGGGAASALGRAGLTSTVPGLAAESLAETAQQRNVDDTIAGRELAQYLGEVADHLGYNGGELTRDLIENKSLKSKAFVATWGFLQNFGINVGAEKLLRLLGAEKPELVNGSEDAARVLGRKPQDVSKALDDTTEPTYSRYQEPHESMDTDSQVPVAKPSKGKEVISDEALVAEALRRGGIGEDGLTSADRHYFTSWKAIADDVKLQKVFQEATSTLKALKSAPDDLKFVYGRALRWWDRNKGLLDDDLGTVELNFARDMVKPLNEGAEAALLLTPSMPIERVLKEFSVANEEGFIASQLVAEELGVRLQKAARVAMNLENASEPIDFTAAIDTILDLHDKVNLFLVPLRRAKRKWYIEGMSQQRKQVKAVQDSDVQSFVKANKKVSYTDPSENLTKIHKDDTDPGMTVRELWNAAQDGDEGALSTLKNYLNLIAYSEPSTILKETNNLTKVLKKQMDQGAKDASAQLFYAYMLSRVSTQVASLSSNVSRLLFEPLGARLSGEAAYGKGQIAGLLAHTQEAWQVALRSFKENAPLNGGSKISDEVTNLKYRQLQLDERYKGALTELAQNGGNDFQRLLLSGSYGFQSFANQPINSVATRLLMASDEATKSLFASQVATGRAYKIAAETNSWDKIDDLIRVQFKRVFKDGVATGKIVDAEVLEGAKQLTFQGDIPTDGNVVDNLFLAVKQGADTSAVMKFFTPFTRVSYNILETAGRYEPTGLLARFMPRYKKILNGELGDVAQLQLKSQMALGRYTTMTIAGLSMLGLTTGYNSGSLPKTSFILPVPGTDNGYVAIPYNRLEPFATIIAVVSDAVNGLRDDVITQGQYDRFMQEMIVSIGMASTDKTFQSGLTDMASILDVKNFGEGSINGIANAGTSAVGSLTGFYGAMARMVADWANPYVTIQAEQGSSWNTFWAKVRQRQFGGVGNPPLYDELTGKPIPKTTTIGPGDNYWAAVGASLVNEVAWPGRIRGTDPSDPVRKALNDLNFTPDVVTSIRTLDGVPLSLTQQSELSKVMHLALRPKLEGYLKSDRYKELKTKFGRFRFDNVAGNTSEGSRSNVYLEKIHADLRKIYRDSKLEAAQRSRELMTDPDFQRKRQAAQLQVPVSNGPAPGNWKGLHSVLGLINK
jgi:hypothetical protein